MPTFVQRSTLPAAADVVFAWHARAGAFERLSPPWQDVRVVERSAEGIGVGTRVVIELAVGPLRPRWVALHDLCEPGRAFRDVQVRGPFAAWTHTHRFHPLRDDASVLEDDVDYRLPGGPLGDLVAGRFVRRELRRMFGFRHRRTRDDLARHGAHASRPLRVVVSGASGLIGRALAAFLTTGGHRVDRLVRRPPAGPGEIAWDPAHGTLDAAALEGADAVVHLAGEPVAGRWTRARKAAIHESRAASTATLAEALARLARPPRVLVSASATGVYGTRPHDAAAVDERAPAGDDFLAQVCRAWEAATAPAARAGIRVVHARIGVVLAAQGGALRTMLPPFRAGLGGVVGSGRQVLSWIALDDVVGALHHLLLADAVSGPVNLVAPEPVTNAELTRTLGHVLGRPARLAVPALAARTALGEMADALLLGGVRVTPRVLTAGGFRFLHPTLEPALRAELGR